MAGTQNSSSFYQLKVHEKQLYDLQLSVNQCDLDLNPRPQKSQNGECAAVTTSPNIINAINSYYHWAVVTAYSVEWSLSTTEVCSSKILHGKFVYSKTELKSRK